MTGPTRSRALLSLWLTLLAAGLAGQGLLVANHETWSVPTDPIGVGTVFAITYGTAGALVLRRRPGNPVARVFIFVTAGAVLAQLTGEYAVLAYTAHADLPLRAAAAWLSGWTFFLSFPIGPTLIFLLFPDGLGGSRWRRGVLGTALLGAMLLITGYLGGPGPVSPSDRVGGFTVPVDNVTGFLSLDLANIVASLGWAVSGLSLIAAVVSAVVRLRHSTGERREQLRWFAYFAAPVAPAFLVHFLIQATGVQVVDIGFPVYYLVYLVGIPVAVGVALLKHRLYDIDLVISRTLVYGSLAVFITAVYVGIAVGVGTLVGSGGKPNLALSIVATAIVAVGFQPVRERVQRLANRLVYGKRATPYEVLAQFSERVAESYSVDDVMPRMARVLAEGTGAQAAQVWLCSDTSWHVGAVWPADSAVPQPVERANGEVPDVDGASTVVGVRHQGDLLGALAVQKRTGEALTPVEESLLTHLAGQAGLVLKNVGLTGDLQARLEDLRASRQRLVTAQDEERRRLERNLHDGAQQHLVALKVKLGLAELLLGRDPDRARETLTQLKGDADEALETLRDLARGIYPPLLADRGLGVALESQARKATIPVRVVADIGRYSQDVEGAVYFAVLEALQNVQKYAAASTVTVHLAEEDGRLRFTVDDDGAGFDPSTTPRGSGLTNMTDRLDAVGGGLIVTSVLGQGTSVAGWVAVAPAATPPSAPPTTPLQAVPG